MRQRLRHFYQLIVTFVVLLLSACFPPYEPVTEAETPLVEFGTFDYLDRSIYFATAGDPQKPMVLFIHGTPGSWQGFASYLQHSNLREKAHLVAIDRPGFGRSRHGEWLPDLSGQAGVLAAVRALNYSKVPPILVGHSLGGTIAYRMAVDYPDDLSALIAISSSIDPEAGKARWYNRLADFGVVRWLVPDDLMRANIEIMPLEKELSNMLPLLESISVPTTVVHGVQDRLVGFENLNFAETHIRKVRVVAVEDAGHFILWDQPDLVVAEIVRLLPE